LQGIDKALRGTDAAQDFDEGLFGMLVERVRVMNIVQVEFVLWAEIRALEIL
jgi:site-specific DNA recombinase